MRVLILYTELAGYFLACIKQLLIKHNDTKLLLVHYPVNPEAPFSFSLSDGLSHLEYNIYLEEEITIKVKEFSPDIILCSGWSNKFYLNIVKKYRKTTKSVVFIDNQWHASFKQYILRGISPFFLTKIFDFAWVPGNPQKNYALKLSFKPNNVFTGLYVADTNLFRNIGERKLIKGGPFPKIMICIARYIVQKDLPSLWKAFILANENTGNRWELNCFGTGELFEKRIENKHIHHLGFKQPEEMEQYLTEAGVFVLPSLFEPWGVAVHEMALSAMPMILSDCIGSVSMFLDGENGYVFKAGDVNHLQSKLQKMMLLEDAELWEMAENSLNKGCQLKLDDWVNTFNKITK